MTHEDRRLFVHRSLWAVIPGLVAGLLSSGVAYGVMMTELKWLRADIERLEEVNERQWNAIGRQWNDIEREDAENRADNGPD